MSRHGRRRRRRSHHPTLVREVVVWGVLCGFPCCAVLLWSGVPLARVALVGAGLLASVLLPAAVLSLSGTRLRNLEALERRKGRRP